MSIGLYVCWSLYFTHSLTHLHKLTLFLLHPQVQEILSGDGESDSGYLASCLQVMYQLTYAWRYQRLGNGHFSHSLSAGQQLALHSHQMMEEVSAGFFFAGSF